MIDNNVENNVENNSTEKMQYTLKNEDDVINYIIKNYDDLVIFDPKNDWATIKAADFSGSIIVSEGATEASGTEYNDTIQAMPIDHTVRSIYANEGNDLVSISGNYGILWSKSTLNGGTGNDSIYIHGDVDGIHPSTVSIDGGSGNDVVSIYGGYSGIHGGTIGLASNEKSSISVNLGDGDDKILIHGANKGIDISNVKISGDSGNDLISIYGSEYGIDGWANYGGSTISIDGGSGADTIAISSIDSLSSVTINAGENDNISIGSGSAKYLFDSTNKVTINGTTFTANSSNSSASLKTASNSITIGSSWDGMVELSNGRRLTDISGTSKNTSGTYSIVDGNFVEINVIKNTKSNVSISGSQGIDSIDNTGSNVLVNCGNGNDSVSGGADKVTINGGSGNDRLEFWGTKSIVNGDSGNDLIYTHAKNVTINGGEGNDTIENWDDNKGWNNGSVVGGAGKNKIISGTGNDSIKNFGQNTTINAGIGNDTIDIIGGYSKNNYIEYASGDGNDIVTGYSTTDTIHITSGTYSTQNSGNDTIIKVGSGSIRLKDSKGINLNIKGNIPVPTPTTLTVTNSTKSPVTVSSAIKTINASTRTTAVKITGNSLANTIYGGKGNDTLTGGNGADVFVYASDGGKDVITDYTAGQDKIKITGAKISKSSVSGNDVILTVGSGSINVKNGKGKKISLYNNATSLTTTVIGSSSTSTSSGSTSTTTSTTLTVTNSTKSPVIVSSKIKTINASSRTTAVKITGNTLANSIVGGKGADTITGGKGADTLKGGRGADVFIYRSGDGNDVITDYTASDKISITGGTYTRSTVGNDVKIKVGSGSILLKNAKTKTVTINNSKSFEERWFIEDNNFITSELNSILKDNANQISDDYDYQNTRQDLQDILIAPMKKNNAKK